MVYLGTTWGLGGRPRAVNTCRNRITLSSWHHTHPVCDSHSGLAFVLSRTVATPLGRGESQGLSRTRTWSCFPWVCLSRQSKPLSRWLRLPAATAGAGGQEMRPTATSSSENTAFIKCRDGFHGICGILRRAGQLSPVGTHCPLRMLGWPGRSSQRPRHEPNRRAVMAGEQEVAVSRLESQRTVLFQG